MELQDTYSFYRSSLKCAQLVDKAVNWSQRHSREFSGTCPNLDCSHFINYYTRATAQLHCWGPRPAYRDIDTAALKIKSMASAFQGSTLTILDTEGKVHGVDIPPERPLKEIWGLTFCIYGTSLDDACQVSAWTSKTGPSLGIPMQEPILKVSSMGYLCGMLTSSRNIYWYKYPHCAHNKSLDSKLLNVPCEVIDMIATRYGFKVVGKDGNLYSFTVLNRYLQELPQVQTQITMGDFTSVEQTSDRYVVYNNQTCYLGIDNTLTEIPIPHVQSVQMVDRAIFMLTRDWDLYAIGSCEKVATFGVSLEEFLRQGGTAREGRFCVSEPIKIPGKYANIVGIEGELCTLRLM